MRKILLTYALIVLIASPISSTSINLLFWKKKDKHTKEEVKVDEYDKMKKECSITEGFIDLLYKDDKLYMDIPIYLMGRDMLLGSTITSTSDNGNGIIGSKPNNPIRFVFLKNDNRVEMRIPSETDLKGFKSIVSAEESAIYKVFKIESFNTDSTNVIINVTDLFINDDKYLTPIDKRGKNTLGGKNKITTSFEKDKSYIDSNKSFDDNLSIKSVLSYKFTIADRGAAWKDVPFTVGVTRSILLLDSVACNPTITDSRIALFPTTKTVFDSDKQGSKKMYYANIWNLVPKDKEAYLRGEKVEPETPITFYVDSAFPEKWKPYILEGVNQWNEVFEEAGFINAICGIPFPENDSLFDADNLKYSCVRYAPISIQNAMGPSWVDDRNGKIINASVYIYHDVIELLNNWIFVQTSQIDKRVRQSLMPDSIIGEGLRYVVSHEIGHCLGFMHNMSGSANVPVDSLRSSNYTRKYGTTTSIMDYARFNYVAQPEDSLKNLGLMPPRFGEYDKFLIKWAYTYLEENDPLKDYEIRSKWLREAYKDPIYRFGKQQFYGILDPRSQTEDLGDNAVLASQYGIKNLKYIMSNFHKWLETEDVDFSYRKSVYSAVVSQYITYLGHVNSYIGGIYLNEKFSGDAHNSFESVSKEMQKEALEFLLKQLDDLEWINDPILMNKLSLTKPVSLKIREYIMTLIMNVPQRTELAAAKSASPFTPSQALDIIYKSIWSPLIKGSAVKEEQMYQQQFFISSISGGTSVKYPKIASVSFYSEYDDNKYLSFLDNQILDEYSAYTEPGALYFESKMQPSELFSYITRIETLLKNNSGHWDNATKAYCKYTLFNLQKALKNEKK